MSELFHFPVLPSSFLGEGMFSIGRYQTLCRDTKQSSWVTSASRRFLAAKI